MNNALEMRSIRRHRSRIGWRVASGYSRYLERCRRECPKEPTLEPTIAAAVEEFRRDGMTSFWTERTGRAADGMRTKLAEREARGEDVWTPENAEGYRNYLGDLWKDFTEIEDIFRADLGSFMTAYFESPFKILHGSLYRTRHVEGPHGSQLWHSDGGPGICVNVMYYLHDTTPENGTLEAIPWNVSELMFASEKKAQSRGELERFRKRQARPTVQFLRV